MAMIQQQCVALELCSDVSQAELYTGLALLQECFLFCRACCPHWCSAMSVSEQSPALPTAVGALYSMHAAEHCLSL
jgi:hypothetical protein